jgi:UDP-GlcNAc:undecaprenyl-phosphate GlcNAc-1-phosphate transferase
MNPIFFAGLAALLLSALTTLALVPRVIRIALRAGAVDRAGGRRVGHEPTPRIGGAAIAVGIGAGAALPALALWFRWGASVTPFEIYGLALGTALIFITGLTEDLIGLWPAARLLIQTAAALCVVGAGWSFAVLYVPFQGIVPLGAWGPVLTVVWIVGVTNAINLLDGLDGLAGGVAAIIATSLLIFATIQGQALTVVLLSAIVGACVGFLRHNWAPARVYMGDSGALTLGFLLAVMSMHGSIKNAAAVAILVPILALGLPVIDTLLVMTVRLAEPPRRGALDRIARVFRADRNHVHHLMLRLAPERKKIVFALYGVAAAFCAMSLAVGLVRSGELGVALIAVEILVVLLMRRLRRQTAEMPAHEVPDTREIVAPLNARAAAARSGSRG